MEAINGNTEERYTGGSILVLAITPSFKFVPNQCRSSLEKMLSEIGEKSTDSRHGRLHCPSLPAPIVLSSVNMGIYLFMRIGYFDLRRSLLFGHIYIA